MSSDTLDSPSWDVRFYETVFKECLEATRFMTLDSLYGPRVQHQHKVTPAALLAALPPLEKFAARMPSLVLNGLRLEKAFYNLIAADKRLMEAEQEPASLSNALANHFMYVSKLCRQMRREDEQQGEPFRWSRRYPKTGGMRTKLSVQQMASVSELLAMMTLFKKQTAAPVFATRDAVVDNTKSVMATVALDDSGWPIICSEETQSMSRTRSAQSLMSVSSAASTVPLDEDGWPTMCSLPDAKPALIGVPTPNQARRKRVTRENKLKQPKTTKTTQVVPDTPPKTTKATTMRTPPKQQHVAWARPLLDVRKSHTTESNPRYEVVGFYTLDGVRQRVHVKTFTRSSHGAAYNSLGAKLFKHIETKKCSKTEALEFVAGLS